MNIGFQEFFSDVASGWLPYILALNLIGGIAMALLQTAKDLFPVRRWFQKRQLENWFTAGTDRVNADASSVCVSARKAQNDLLALAANGDHRAFFDLQIEQLSGLFNATTQVVLESPEVYGDLLRVVASRANPKDVELVVSGAAEKINQTYLDARNRVLHHCQRAIGAFQIDCDFRWKWSMQLAALVLSTTLSWLALSFGAVSAGAKTMSANPVSVVVTSLLAGFLAPVAKDLLAIVQRARGD